MTINYYVDISDHIEDKIQVAECHKSQIKKYKKIGFDVPNRLRVLAEFRGIQANCKYAEGFHIIKKVENGC